MVSETPIVDRPAGGSDTYPAGNGQAFERGVADARGSRLERLSALVLSSFLVSLPIVWLTVSPIAGGFIKPFHIIALALILVCLARWTPVRFIRPILARHWAIYGAYFLLLALTFSGGLAFRDPYTTPAGVFRAGFYAGTSLIVAALVLRLVERRTHRSLAWVGLVAVVVLVVAFYSSLAAVGTNPASLVAEALRKGDPDIISYRLLRTTFRSDDIVESGANLRHKVFLGLLVAVYAGMAFQSAVHWRRRWVPLLLVIASVCGFVVSLASLSRSTIVCMAVAVLLVPLRVLVGNRARPAQAALMVVATVLIVGVGGSALGSLVFIRFGSTGSLESRLDSVGSDFFDTIQHAFLIGIPRTGTPSSPHNLLLDAGLGAGLLGMLCAAVLLVALGGLWLREARRYVTSKGGWLLPVGQVWLLAIGVVPLVRSVTAGNQFHMVEWTAIGLFLGLTYANERKAAAMEAARAGPARRAEVVP